MLDKLEGLKVLKQVTTQLQEDGVKGKAQQTAEMIAGKVDDSIFAPIGVNPEDASDTERLGAAILADLSDRNIDAQVDGKNIFEGLTEEQQDAYKETAMAVFLGIALDGLAETKGKESSPVMPIVPGSQGFRPALGTFGGGYPMSGLSGIGSNYQSYGFPKMNDVNPASAYYGDLTQQSAEAAQIDQFLNGKLEGKGQLIINLCTQPMKGRNGKDLPPIDPALVAAIIGHETTWGTSNAVNTKNNVAGMMDVNTGCQKLKVYNSIDQSLFEMVRNLRENYIAQGRTTIASIGEKYCPVGAKNDPNDLNKHWIGGVTENMRKIMSATG